MNLYLIDGYGFVFRAFHSLPPLASPEGIPVSAVYGFINMITKILEKREADFIAIALDSGGQNHRHRLFSQYKANRTEPDEDLKVQFPIIREAIHALNVAVLEEQGVEADDLIATYAVTAANHGFKVTIIASDKDLMQLLVYDDIAMYDPVKNKTITHEDVYKKFGVFPDKLTDALALMGDSSDNIPGVKGIGPKTAASLLEQWGSLEGIYNNLEAVENSRIRNLLEINRDNALLSKELVTLLTDMTMQFTPQELKVAAPDPNTLSAFLSKYGFKSLQHKLGLSDINSPVQRAADIKFQKISSLAGLAHAAADLENCKMMAMHEAGDLITISSEARSYAIDIADHSRDLFASNDILNFKQVSVALKTALESTAVLKILINSKAWLKKLATFGIKLNAFDDIAVMAYALETGKSDYSFSGLLETYAEHQHAETAHTLLSLYTVLSRKIHLAKKHEFCECIEKPMIATLAAMEMKGIKVDALLLKELDMEFNHKAKVLAEQIYREANIEFNIGSPKQLGDVLFAQLGIKGGKKSSKTGLYSTDSDILEQLADQGCEIAKLVIQWRRITKLIGTYTSALPKSIDNKTGRIHTTFEVTGTSTGRLSSNSPNLQNIPVRTAEGRNIRRAFVADKGYSFLSADYSQIELRLLAHVANIQELKQSFIRGQDIHAVTASQIFHIPIEQVSPELRYRAKSINFGIIYGISAFGLARNIDISKQEAAHYIEEYFKRYPGIKEYMDNTIAFARQHGFVRTLCGRTCFITGINDKNFTKRSFAERAAINAPLQGAQADIIKKAMVTLPQEIKQYLLLQIHDELLFEIPQTQTESISGLVKKHMENIIHLSLPLEVDIAISKSWDKHQNL